MDTIFSDHRLTANRLAELLVTPEVQHVEKLEEWFRDDRRPAMHRNYYRPTLVAVEELHRRIQGVEELRLRVMGWQLDAEASKHANTRDQLNHNVRATTQYLNLHGERQMTVFDRQQFEPVVHRVRISVRPHLSVHTDGMPMRIWIDCSETLREEFLKAKCDVTLWAAHVERQATMQVEVVHSATNRFVARGALPQKFEARVTAACEATHRVWTRLSAPVHVSG